MTCRFLHRWSGWTTEYEETPDGWMAVYQIRARACRRPGCRMIEEIPRSVSLSPEVLRLNWYYRETS